MGGSSPNRAKARKLVEEEEESRWSNMHPQLLEYISDYLPFPNCMQFHSVCKGWRSAPFGRYDLSKFDNVKPWLMFYGFNNDSKCYLYSHSHPSCCTFRLPALTEATCVDSNKGWLLAHKERHFFFYNPFSLTRVDLLEYPQVVAGEQLFTFTGLPTSPTCTLYIISRKNASTIEISSCHVGDEKWDVQNLNINEKQFGNMTFATYYCTKEALNRSYVIVFESSGWLSYDISRRRYYIHKQGLERWNGTNKNTLYEDMELFHRADWLSRFGKNGISITTCSLHMRLTKGVGINRGEHIICCKPLAKLNNVKAVWIEPPFYQHV